MLCGRADSRIYHDLIVKFLLNILNEEKVICGIALHLARLEGVHSEKTKQGARCQHSSSALLLLNMLFYEHCITEAEEAIAFLNRVMIRCQRLFTSGKGTY